MDVADYANVGVAVGFPLLALHLHRRGVLPNWSSPIVLCYALGIVIANLRLWPVDARLAEGLAGGSMVVGLPLLLFAVRIGQARRRAGSMLLSFGLCCLTGLCATAVTALLFLTELPDGWKVAGMLTGLYIGGTPNVQAIGIALAAPADYLVLLQAADIILGGAYLIGLLTFLPGIYARFFPLSSRGGAAGEGRVRVAATPLRVATLIVLSIAVGGSSALLCYLTTGAWFSPTLLILILTTVSLLLPAVVPQIRRLGDSYPVGEYFILIFCVAIGLLADFRALADRGLELLAFSAVALSITTLLHLLLCRYFKLDRDTVILGYVAALYGPVFVAQVAAALGNRRLLAAGLAASLLGLGIGNYLGIGLAFLLRALLAT